MGRPPATKPSHNKRGLTTALQRDNGFQLGADVDRLLDATRSLLDELGLEVDDHTTSEPMNQEAAGAGAPPSPLRQPEHREPVDVAVPSVLEQDVQAPPSPLPQQGHASPTKTVVAQVAAFRGRGGSGSVARSRTPPPAGAEAQSPAPVRVEGEGVAVNAMDVP